MKITKRETFIGIGTLALITGLGLSGTTKEKANQLVKDKISLEEKTDIKHQADVKQINKAIKTWFKTIDPDKKLLGQRQKTHKKYNIIVSSSFTLFQLEKNTTKLKIDSIQPTLFKKMPKEFAFIQAGIFCENLKASEHFVLYLSKNKISQIIKTGTMSSKDIIGFTYTDGKGLKNPLSDYVASLINKAQHNKKLKPEI